MCVDYDTQYEMMIAEPLIAHVYTTEKKLEKKKSFNNNALKRKLCNIFSLMLLIFYVNIYAPAERYRFAFRRNI